MSSQGSLFDQGGKDSDPEQQSEAKTKPQSLEGTLTGPLADRVRPQRLEQFVGQEHLLGPTGPLRLAIEKDKVPSFLLWGPPGSGKTTLARIVAWHTDQEFVALSAVTSGVKDIKEVIERARMNLSLRHKRTILFIDEIHRFNKAQQDALLPHVEDGTVTFIGATTENPSFSLNSALLSRLVVYTLKPHEPASVNDILKHALADPRGISISGGLTLAQQWFDVIGRVSAGDARRALGILERVAAVIALDPVLSNEKHRELEFSDELFQKALGHNAVRYDSSEEEHYNVTSAFIKSLRDSDPDAALYYLARMIEGGEDPLFIARRLVIFASEDVGNADPRAITLAMSVRDAVHAVGMPEGRIPLAQAVTFLATAPKSNASYMGIEEALSDVRQLGALEVPMHIRNAPTKLMKNLGYSKGYQYAHNHDPETYVGMTNLPDKLADREYYQPKDSGLEKQIKERVQLTRSSRRGRRGNRPLSTP